MGTHSIKVSEDWFLTARDQSARRRREEQQAEAHLPRCVWAGCPRPQVKGHEDCDFHGGRETGGRAGKKGWS